MVPNDALINAIRALGFEFKDQKDRVLLYKKKGSTLRLEIRRISLHDPAAVRSILRQAGMPAAEIECFLNQYKARSH